MRATDVIRSADLDHVTADLTAPTSSADVFAWLSDEPVVAQAPWPPSAVLQGTDMARDGQVVELGVAAKDSLQATVAGAGVHSFRVVVRSSQGDQGFASACTCHVGALCGHVFAALAVTQAWRGGVDGGDSAAGVTWQDVLGGAVSAVTAASTADSPGLGVGLDVVAVTGREASWVIRPLKRTRTGKWSPSLTWDRLRRSTPPAAPGMLPTWEDLMLFIKLHDISAGSGWLAGGDPVLDRLSPEQLMVLARLIDHGLFVRWGYSASKSTQAAGCLAVSPDTARPVLDVRATSTGDLRVVARWATDDVGAGSVGFRGDEDVSAPGVATAAAHPTEPAIEAMALAEGESWFIGNPISAVMHATATGATMHRLVQPLPAGLGQVVTADAPIVVPRSEQDAFFAHYASRLDAVLPVVSSDGSVRVPKLSKPQLSVHLHHHGDVTGTAAVSFRYVFDDVSHEVSVDPRDNRLPRNVEQERALVAELGGLPVADGEKLAGERYQAVCDLATEMPYEGAPVVWQHHGTPTQFAPLVGPLEIQMVVNEDSTDPDWFGLSFAVKVAGKWVPAGNLITDLMKGKSRCVLGSGERVDLTTPELQEFRELLLVAQRHQPPESSTLCVNQHQVWWLHEILELGTISVQAAKWWDSVTALAEPPKQYPLPAGAPETIRDYQRTGYSWLSRLWDANLGGILADSMGLGKTLQVLTMLARVYGGHGAGDVATANADASNGDEGRATLVVVPTSMVHPWVAEANKFYPGLQVFGVDRTLRKARLDLAEVAADHDVVVTSYQRLRLDAKKYREVQWAGLVLDEAQTVKNFRSQTFRAAAELNLPRKFLLTGTPLENSLMDLWSLMRLAAPGLLPRQEVFDQHYARPIMAGKGADQLGTLHQLVAPFMLRRTKDAVAQELPSRTVQVVPITLHPTHQRLYNVALTRERQNVLGLLKDDRGQSRRVDVLAALTRLRRLSLDVRITGEQYDGDPPPSEKVTWLVEQLQQITDEGHKVLVFSQYTDFLDVIQAALAETTVTVSRLDGQTRSRKAVIQQFREQGPGAFLLSLKAGGVGLTLTEADFVFITDPWWNPAAENQAIDRTHRIGQDKPVTVYRMMSEATIEEKVFALQQRKQDLFDSVIDSDNIPSTLLSNDDVLDLLKTQRR